MASEIIKELYEIIQSLNNVLSPPLVDLFKFTQEQAFISISTIFIVSIFVAYILFRTTHINKNKKFDLMFETLFDKAIVISILFGFFTFFILATTSAFQLVAISLANIFLPQFIQENTKSLIFYISLPIAVIASSLFLYFELKINNKSILHSLKLTVDNLMPCWIISLVLFLISALIVVGIALSKPFFNILVNLDFLGITLFLGMYFLLITICLRLLQGAYWIQKNSKIITNFEFLPIKIDYKGILRGVTSIKINITKEDIFDFPAKFFREFFIQILNELKNKHYLEASVLITSFVFSVQFITYLSLPYIYYIIQLLIELIF